MADWKKLKDKEWLYEVIFESDTPLGRHFDVAVMIAIIVSVLIAFVETMPKLAHPYKTVLDVIEYVLTAFFTIEYIARVYCSPSRKKYILSFFGLIDLFATLPSLFSILFPAFRYALLLRSARLIRVFRVFKLFAFINEGYLLLESIKKSLTKIIVYFLFVLILVTVLGTIMFVVENGHSKDDFTSIPQSIYWAIVTMTTVGYGDITPHTSLGHILSSCIMILGYTIIAIPTGIVSATMIDVTKEKVKDGRCPRCNGKVDKKDVYCRHCGERL